MSELTSETEATIPTVPTTFTDDSVPAESSFLGATSFDSPTYWLAFGVSLVFASLVFYKAVYPPLRRRNLKETRLDQIEAHYDRLRGVRKDIVFHYHWAVERKDYKVRFLL